MITYNHSLDYYKYYHIQYISLSIYPCCTLWLILLYYIMIDDVVETVYVVLMIDLVIRVSYAVRNDPAVMANVAVIV